MLLSACWLISGISYDLHIPTSPHLHIHILFMTQSFDPTTPLFSGNSTFIEELYERYLQNPQSVDPSWRDFFRSVTNGAATPAQRAASWAQVRSQVIGARLTDDGGRMTEKKGSSAVIRQPSADGEAIA